MLADNAERVQFVLTLQTSIIPADSRFRLEQQLTDVSSSFRNFRNRLNYRIFRQASRRKPSRYSLLCVPIIEGLKFSPYGCRSLHYHVAIGNVPSEVQMEDLELFSRNEWQKCRFGGVDVHLRPASTGFSSYITKEISHNDALGVDWCNVAIPSDAFQLRS